jgi:hypothetical protein
VGRQLGPGVHRSEQDRELLEKDLSQLFPGMKGVPGDGQSVKVVHPGGSWFLEFEQEIEGGPDPAKYQSGKEGKGPTASLAEHSLHLDGPGSARVRRGGTLSEPMAVNAKAVAKEAASFLGFFRNQGIGKGANS